MSYQENVFLRHLQNLQQDGSGAISLPAGWLQAPPLLEVETPLDVELTGIIAALGNEAGPKRWHFFVGSPGNGKSAATGKLVRKLASLGWTFTDQDKTPLENLPQSEIPYLLYAYRPGQAYAAAWIAQDASVVPDPYSDRVDPVVEFGKVLEGAAKKPVSLIACTNRGVIESLYSLHITSEERETPPWFDAVSAVVNTKPRTLVLGPAGRQASVECRSTALDARSLVIGSNVFGDVVRLSVDPEKWIDCNSCAAQSRCPFYQNSQWLRDDSRRDGFVKSLRRAEALSGRVIVFREALALLSLILSGCPHDHGAGSPCRWVQDALERGDVFSLLARRIYAVLYSSYAQLGLEASLAPRAIQVTAIGKLADAAGRPEVSASLSAPPSSDVGVPSLLGAGGIFQELDPFAGPIPRDLQERWDDDKAFADPRRGGSDLEADANAIWAHLRASAETRSDLGGDVVGWLERWIGAFTVRAAALAEGYTTFGSELDELVDLLANPSEKTTERTRSIRKLEITLNDALRAGAEGVRIAPYAQLVGHWVNEHLKAKPATARLDNIGNLSLPVDIGAAHFKMSLPGRAYAWLRYRDNFDLSLETFPGTFLTTARDALARAAAEGGYYKDDGVQVRVTCPNGRSVILNRSDESVYRDE